MAKIEINIALNKLMGAFTCTIKGSTANKECICIPKDQLSVDGNGNIWLNMSGTDDNKFDRQTHSIKQKINKTQYDSLPVGADGRKALLPFLGMVREAKQHAGGSDFRKEQLPAPTFSEDRNETGDLPF